ncbi:Hypothetical protein ORPV_749 [Orpheovirus IHUMI-LCC2]|uniref:Uncharacterized protein n=1 Tax=Orpheovirus IHUMI-LCC2 TaxID=2023057 RepID=A0A2I2L542_9VIRU|nr:Hypothetical protein ORPV_749 [Orpheovirus IHUMI-LCC2]SNW62653.1 Hypothetical protein ORPV_749 [Orpheovirus IHUMI-LCC2]
MILLFLNETEIINIKIKYKMVCFIRSTYTFNPDDSDRNRFFCTTFDEFLAKIKKYLPPSTDIKVSGYVVEVMTSYPAMMHHILPNSNLPNRVSKSTEDMKNLLKVVESRFSFGGHEVFVSRALPNTKTTEDALDLLSSFVMVGEDNVEYKVSKMLICSDMKSSAEIYFIIGHHLFVMNDGCVSDWSGFGYDLDLGRLFQIN